MEAVQVRRNASGMILGQDICQSASVSQKLGDNQLLANVDEVHVGNVVDAGQRIHIDPVEITDIAQRLARGNGMDTLRG